MKTNLHLDKITRKNNIERLEKYQDIYFKRISPNFDDIEVEAENYMEEFYNKLNSKSSNCEGDLPFSAEFAKGEAISYYSDLQLAKYNVLTMFIVTLYQIWEQQVRKFLYDEMKSYFEINFKEFCTNFGQIKEIFLKNKFDLENQSFFNKINELRLLTNVIKHAEGHSSKKLKKLNPNLFKQDNFANDLEIETMKNTLLDITLNVHDKDFRIYCNALEDFWISTPEDLYSDKNETWHKIRN